LATENEKNSRMWEAFTEEEFLRGRALLLIPINGMIFERVKFGDSGHFSDEYECCPDCGAEKGQVHIPVCEMERCPNCKGQLGSCPCEIAELGPEWERFVRDREAGYQCIHGESRPEPKHTWPKPS
jgi:hypothetical protein